jgi:hypothetical protein
MIMKNDLFLPFIKSDEYIAKLPYNSIVYGRKDGDFQKDCFLFKNSTTNSFNKKYVLSLKNKGIRTAYVYDMFDFENKEFTVQGYQNIRKDIDNIVEMGFKFIIVSNPYIIELLCNEYRTTGINVVISSLLEINSTRGKIFFDVLNDTSIISHIILSQNHMSEKHLNAILKQYPNIKIVLEIDRFASDNQIVHENYYNWIYGYYNEYVLKYLNEYIERNKAYTKKANELFYSNENLCYKLGEINASANIVLNNLYALKEDINNMKIVDYYLWKNNNHYSMI